MKKIFWAILLISSNSYGQGVWEVLNAPQLGRYDDLFFLNDSVGWAVGVVINPSPGIVYKTTDGGSTWLPIDTFPFYLRSIEFINEQVGFLGTLDSTSFLKTVDGGYTWTSVVDTMPVKPKAICGISAADSNVIVACGAYMGYPCFLKSTDGGVHWTYKNMSSYAHALVDVLLVTEQEGFLIGTAKVQATGGVILHTTNGGTTWQEVFRSMATAKETNWKIYRLDSLHYYSSLESSIPTSPSRYFYSSDGGMTWDTTVITSVHIQQQAIGFLDTLHGFAGGYNTALYETKDGGQTWDSTMLGNNYNRFWHTHGKTSFLTGKNIYRYTDTTGTHIDTVTRISEPNKYGEFDDKLNVFPNPASKKITVAVDLMVNTYALINILSPNGTVEKEIFSSTLPKGQHQFDTDITQLPAGVHFAQIHTHLGTISKAFVVK